VNAAQILQGIQADTTAELLIFGVFLLCTVLLIYVWTKGREDSEEEGDNLESIKGGLNSDSM
jgi:hypothetical protein